MGNHFSFQIEFFSITNLGYLDIACGVVDKLRNGVRGFCYVVYASVKKNVFFIAFLSITNDDLWCYVIYQQIPTF